MNRVHERKGEMRSVYWLVAVVQLSLISKIAVGEPNVTVFGDDTYINIEGKIYLSRDGFTPQWPVIPNRILLTTVSGTTVDEAWARERGIAARKIIRSRDGINSYVALVDDSRDPMENLADVFSAPGILSAKLAPALVTARNPNDTRFPDQWQLEDARIGVPAAWDITRGHGVDVIAIIDSGADTNHPDLAGCLWQNAGEIAGNGEDDDDNGYEDDIVGYDFFNDDPTPEDTNINSHGTAVAGIAAGKTNNGMGVAGIAGGWNATESGTKLMILKVGGTNPDLAWDAILDAFDYATNNGADIINCSFATLPPADSCNVNYAPAPCDEILQALDGRIDAAVAAGAIVVCAAGNLGFQLIYPASDYSTIAVGASDPNDLRWDDAGGESNYGPRLDLLAPGGTHSVVALAAGGAYDVTPPTGPVDLVNSRRG